MQQLMAAKTKSNLSVIGNQAQCYSRLDSTPRTRHGTSPQKACHVGDAMSKAMNVEGTNSLRPFLHRVMLMSYTPEL